MPDNGHAFLSSIIDAIREAENDDLLENPPDGDLYGFSGDKFVGLLQRVVKLSDSDTCYVEIGVFQGLTLLSVAFANKDTTCIGIDNFAFLNKEKKNLAIVEDRIAALALSNIRIANQDFENAFDRLDRYIKGKKIGVLLVDGPHDYRSQLASLQLAKPYLARNAVLVVDDSNYEHVRQANRDFLRYNTDFKLLFEAYTDCHPVNMATEQQSDARKGWWDGVNVMVHDPDDLVEPDLPFVGDNTSAFNNDHRIHACRMREITPEIVFAYQSLFSWKHLFKQIGVLTVRHWQNRKRFRGRMFSSHFYGQAPTSTKYARLRD